MHTKRTQSVHAFSATYLGKAIDPKIEINDSTMALTPDPKEQKVETQSNMIIKLQENEEEEEEEDGDLFEINLEIVNKIPPPHYWESYFTATSNALLANCLLPIADVSSAVPMVVRACDDALAPPSTGTSGDGQQPASFVGAFMLQYKL